MDYRSNSGVLEAAGVEMTKVILQSESSECGLACLAMIASHHGYQTDLHELRKRFAISLKGATLAQVMRHATSLQFSCRPLRLELDEIDQLALPCILHWNLNHFVVLTKVKKGIDGNLTLHIIDPAVGVRKVSKAETSQRFTGVALELAPSPDFATKPSPPRMPIKELVGKIVGVRRAVIQLIVLAIALELFAIVMPLFNQFVTDEVIVSADRDLLRLLIIGFGILMVTQTAISLARSWFLMRWSIEVGVQWTNRVFSHLLRLPTAFFEKRHLGDITSRFSSIGAIQNTLTGLLVESALDGFMALFALAMMFLYSPKLSAVVMLGCASYVVLRLLAYYPFREAFQEKTVLAAKESSNFLETIRAITPLKLYGRESERQARWLNLRQDVINRDVKTQKLSIVFKVSNSLISGVLSLTMFYIGAGDVMDHVLTIGMLFAFNSYATTFSGRFFSLVDTVIDLRMLRFHMERLSEIILEPIEPEVGLETDLSRLSSDITLRNIRFRYADGEPWILDGVNLHIPAGQSIAVIGDSGCGKSTLCKIILGLLMPTEGEVLIGGVPVKQVGLRAYRSLVGTVMQDDILLAGSIAENISFYSAHVDVDRIERCARLASVHDEIAMMPMGYQTLLGEMGGNLSGGQKQRILLARALYKNPRVLALDEATSHLDINNEKKVSRALSRLELTRIMVAHRPETINMAECVVLLSGGKLHQIRSEPVRDAAIAA